MVNEEFNAEQPDTGNTNTPALEASETVETEAAPAAEAVTEVATETPAEAAAEAAESVEAEQPEAAAAAEAPRLVLPLADMSPEERFRATTRLIFLAPDVPPIQPRPRRSEFGRLDDILDQRFNRGYGNAGQDRDARDHWDNRDGRDARDTRESREDRDAAAHQRRTRRRTDRFEQAQEEEAPRRQPRQAPIVTEPQKVKGSTRLEAKKQRRRDGRDAGRRRVVITESEFLARRESVDREMIVRTTSDRVQIGVLEDKVLVEHYVARSSENSLIGNVYLGRVQNVLPSMEAAFVDIGRGRNAVLYSGEVDWSEFEGGNAARKIENALKPGDHVLVQVTKDPVGHKGARLTSQISLPGRFLVYVPGGAMNGISRKLPDTERARLKKILKEVLPTGAGVIVRTAAEGASEDQLTHDVQRLTRQWESIQARVAKGGGPVLLHSEPDMLIKIVRDVFNEDFHRLRISGNDTYEVIENYLSQVAPDLLERVIRYEGERDIFDEFRVTEQIAKALDRKVWLPSGGSLVIDRTEAMTVVDVNTGKFVGSGGNLEETVTKNNLEAAEEIVRQLRLRDIGGIIVVDFIDMVLESNRDLVLRRMVECLSRDRTKHQVAEVTSLGLVQMTRKKLGLGLLESFSEPCDICAGRGVVVQHEPVTKHRVESAPTRNNSKRGKGGQQQNHQHQQQNHQQQSPQGAEAKGQAHAITEGAKNMLAQVAASTLPGAKDDADSGQHSETSVQVAAEASAPERKERQERPERVTGRVSQRKPRSERAERSEQALPSSQLLDSVLNALPDAPAAGTGRARNRRVSAPQSSSSSATQTTAASTNGAGSSLESLTGNDAQLSLFEALDATSKRKAAERE